MAGFLDNLGLEGSDLLDILQIGGSALGNYQTSQAGPEAARINQAGNMDVARLQDEGLAQRQTEKLAAERAVLMAQLQQQAAVEKQKQEQQALSDLVKTILQGRQGQTNALMTVAGGR